MQEEPVKKTFAAREEEILSFWNSEEIFKKTLRRKAPRGEFIFYDGPPFATGLPHYGHILAGTIKDVIPRYKTMRGFHVPRRWGWDCHGLPVENEVEKELGFKSKKDILTFGIEAFNERAEETVMRYAKDWRRIIPRLGRFVDMENDYRTMDSSYTESVWWVFKNLYEKGLIYEGFKSMHLCPRCETTLSNFEVTQGYKELTDTSVYVKCALSSEANTYLVLWTTTPWTLPGNVALAVHPEHLYTTLEITASNAPELKTGDRYVVGAKEGIIRRVFGQADFVFDQTSKSGSFSWNGNQVAFSAKEEFAGKKLVGLSYLPLFTYYTDPSRHLRLAHRERGWRVYGASFVTEEDGTGIVHIAPAFGEDDYALSQKESLPFIQHVSSDGTFAADVVDFAGLQAKPKGNPKETDEKIAALLEERGTLLRRELYTHEYPHCWRCDTPLLNFAAPSWFVRVSALREKLTEENKKIRWVPKEVGEYRFGNWLAEAKDWAISRSRFWGAPVPVWRCERCHALKTIGSLDELRLRSGGAITKVILLRHGESEKNRRQLLDDSPEGFSLTREGKREVQKAAAEIRRLGGADVIFSSPVKRARETAAFVGKVLGTSVEVREGFREVDSGGWDGRRTDDESIAAARAAYYNLPLDQFYKSKRGGTGESWEEVEGRMSAELAAVVSANRGKTVLIVSHEGPLVYLLRALGNLSLEEAGAYFNQERFEEYAKPMTIYIDHETQKEFDLHRPFIDSITLSCEECEKTTGTGTGLMRRVPEVFDCWFESGSMPYGQRHYPFENKGVFDPVGGFFKKKKGFPADFIAEGLDQTRGWFYSMLVLGTALFGASPYKTVVVNGIILAENGAKMSKRLKNYPDPLDVVNNYGADSLRYYLLSSPAVRGEDLRFSLRGVDEVMKKVFNRLDNVLAFYLLYADSVKERGLRIKNSQNILDRWITVRLHQVIAEVTEALEQYELDRATRPLGDFVDDLSTWYLRRSRERIKSDDVKEKDEALSTLGFVLSEFSKLLAPFVPFFAEHLFQKITSNNQPPTTSVHLEDWPEGGRIDREILSQMVEVRTIVSSGLEARAKANIKVRQPLQKLEVKGEKLKVPHELHQLIKDEVNVREIIFNSELQSAVSLDTVITPELKEEGQFRELARFVQDMRKRVGLKPGEFATLTVGASSVSRRFIEQREQELAKLASLKDIRIQEETLAGDEFKEDEIVLTLALSRE